MAQFMTHFFQVLHRKVSRVRVLGQVEAFFVGFHLSMASLHVCLSIGFRPGSELWVLGFRLQSRSRITGTWPPLSFEHARGWPGQMFKCLGSFAGFLCAAGLGIPAQSLSSKIVRIPSIAYCVEYLKYNHWEKPLKQCNASGLL